MGKLSNRILIDGSKNPLCYGKNERRVLLLLSKSSRQVIQFRSGRSVRYSERALLICRRKQENPAFQWNHWKWKWMSWGTKIDLLTTGGLFLFGRLVLGCAPALRDSDWLHLVSFRIRVKSRIWKSCLRFANPIQINHRIWMRTVIISSVFFLLKKIYNNF